MQRVVLISGGGSGIGAAVAERFASCDDHIVITGRRQDKLEATAQRIRAKRADASITTVAADVADPAGATAVITAVRERFGTIDVLVANAGGNPSVGDTDGLEGVTAEWHANFTTNVLSAVVLVTAARPLLTEGGRVLMFSSIAAYRGSGGSGAYGATKAALHGYLPVLAAQLGTSGITANLIAPGYVSDTEFFGGELPPQRRKTLIEQTMTKREGTPDDVADLVEFLASGRAAHRTAQIFQLNGGAERGR